MICFVDPLYFRSGWCNFELQTFLSSVHSEHCRCGRLMLVTPIPWDSDRVHSLDSYFWKDYLSDCRNNIRNALELPRCGSIDPIFLRYGRWPTI
jgi:hypothetical protein